MRDLRCRRRRRAIDARPVRRGPPARKAWLTAARRVRDFRGDRGDFAGWLFGIARNVARSHYRRTRPTSALPDAAERWSSDADPERTVAGDDLTRRLVASLPEREAQVVACLDVVGLDVASTARALGINPTAVRVAHHRGLRRLRKIWPEM